MINFKNKLNKWLRYFCLLAIFLAANIILMLIVIYSLQKNSQYIESILPFILIILIIGLVIWLFGKLKFIKAQPSKSEKIVLYIAIIFSLYWILALFFSYTCVLCNEGEFPLVIKWADWLYGSRWFRL